VVDRGRRHVPGCWRSTGYMVIADLCPGSDAVYLPMPSPFRLLTNTALVLAMLPLGAYARAEPAPEHALAQAEPAPEHVLTQAEPAPEHVLTQAEPAPEHVLVDMQVWLAPPQPQGYCVQLEPGTLSVQLEAVGHGEDGQGEPWPVSFSFYGYRGFDRPATIETTLSALGRVDASAHLQGGDLYCFFLQNLVPVSADASNAEITRYWQAVNVRMAIQS
jgi:hypothetical protein